jgi:hypothetical protein
MNTRGIIPITCGGLGNQIFIVMAGYIGSLHNNCPLYLINNDESNNCHSKKNYKHTLFKNIGIHINENSKTIRNNHNFSNYCNHHLHSFQNFDPWNVESIKPGMFLESFYQYYEAFSPFEKEIRNVILNGLESYRKQLCDKYNFENCGFIHIRRGDYLEHSDRFYIQPISYYEYCINDAMINKPNVTKFYIITDDNDWVLKEPFFKNDCFELITDCDDEEKALAFMSLCKDVAICANSTFSWWGAFLGTYELRNPVYVPKEWIFSHTKCQIFPPEWNLI